MKTIAVLGGGSPGFTAARIASETGARVLFFMGDNADHASLCVNAGCMPSKALFEPIEAMHHAKPHRHVARITPIIPARPLSKQKSQNRWPRSYATKFCSPLADDRRWINLDWRQPAWN